MPLLIWHLLLPARSLEFRTRALQQYHIYPVQKRDITAAPSGGTTVLGLPRNDPDEPQPFVCPSTFSTQRAQHDMTLPSVKRPLGAGEKDGVPSRDRGSPKSGAPIPTKMGDFTPHAASPHEKHAPLLIFSLRRLSLIHLRRRRRRRLPWGCCNSMGLLLKKTNSRAAWRTNITRDRDVAEDAAERSYFWPREIWARGR
ncbi:hypothetical protein DFH09DRAFT_1357971 [Mycena vulgaris]|nr:hypothetical protein DFH09DRAFT_1357971 [Mycena vulgaris]